MSDQTHDREGGDKPLFRQTDAQERLYAPQQVPGAIRDDIDEDRARDATEPVVPGTVSSAIDTPIPGAKAIDDPLDRENQDLQRRAR
jgi:hypothetical protein